MSLYKVSLNWEGNYGYVAYDTVTREIFALINDAPEIARKVEEYLSKPHTMDLPDGDNVRSFSSFTIEPSENVDSFKRALTRLWNSTGVLVEWSLPPEMAEKL